MAILQNGCINILMKNNNKILYTRNSYLCEKIYYLFLKRFFLIQLKKVLAIKNAKGYILNHCCLLRADGDLF